METQCAGKLSVIKPFKRGRNDELLQTPEKGTGSFEGWEYRLQPMWEDAQTGNQIILRDLLPCARREGEDESCN
jgi:hypothetical protein